MAEQYFKLGHGRFIPHPFQVITHYPVVRRCIIWITDSVDKWTVNEWPLLGNACDRHARNNRTTRLCNPFLRNGSVNTATTIGYCWKPCFLFGPCRVVIKKGSVENNPALCGGGVEYLYSSPASRRRRRKGKSGIWDSKIWSRVPRDSDPRMTVPAKASDNCKRHTRPHQREHHTSTNPQLSDSNKNLAVSPRCVLYSKTEWPTDRLTVGRNVRLRIVSRVPEVEVSSWSSSGVPSEQLVEFRSSKWAVGRVPEFQVSSRSRIGLWMGRLRSWRYEFRCGV
jgi:hypothetical protein